MNVYENAQNIHIGYHSIVFNKTWGSLLPGVLKISGVPGPNSPKISIIIIRIITRKCVAEPSGV